MEKQYIVRIQNNNSASKFQEVISSKILLDLDDQTISVFWGSSNIREIFPMSMATLGVISQHKAEIFLMDTEYDRRYAQ